ncbi:MAG: MerC domain-containing protein [Gemmatimonadaceae bacterium]
MPNAQRGRTLPIANANAARVAGSLGVLACVLCCVSIPSVVAVITALGLGFLRNDRLLFPAEVVSLIVLLWTLLRSRGRHGRSAPLIAGAAAAAWMFLGLRSRGAFGTIAALSGAAAVVAVIIWDWRTQRSCTPRLPLTR